MVKIDWEQLRYRENQTVMDPPYCNHWDMSVKEIKQLTEDSEKE